MVTHESLALDPHPYWTGRFRNGAVSTYKEVNRDEWSVYLENADSRVQLDLFRKECTWVTGNNKRINDVVAAHAI